MKFFTQNKLSPETLLRLELEASREFKNGNLPYTIVVFVLLIITMYFLRSWMYKDEISMKDGLNMPEVVFELLFIILTSIYTFYRRRVNIDCGSIEWNQRIYFTLASISIFYMINTITSHGFVASNKSHDMHCLSEIPTLRFFVVYSYREMLVSFSTLILLWVFPLFCTYVGVLCGFIVTEYFYYSEFHEITIVNCKTCKTPINYKKSTRTGFLWHVETFYNTYRRIY